MDVPVRRRFRRREIEGGRGRAAWLRCVDRGLATIVGRDRAPSTAAEHQENVSGESPGARSVPSAPTDMMNANRIFAKEVLRSELFADPFRLLDVLRGPDGDGWLERKWAYACAMAREPGGHGAPRVVARGADRRSVLIAVPRADAPNDTAFVAAVHGADGPRLWLYERTLDPSMSHLSRSEGVLAVLEPTGRRSTFGPQPGVDEAAALRALGPQLGPVEQVGRPRSISWGTIAVSVPLILVGLLTWTEARREATNFRNEWLLLSMSLLLVGFAGLAFAAGRRLGKAGWVGGGAIGVTTMVALLVAIGARIEEREAWQRDYASFEALRGFCEGKGRADGSARPYKRGGPNPTVVFTNPYQGAAFSQAYSGSLARWAPRESRVRETALVACVEVLPAQVLQRCAYDAGTLSRLRESRAVSLYEVRSGKQLARTVLTGPVPEACKPIEKFYSSAGQASRGGGLPTDDEVIATLRPLVE